MVAGCGANCMKYILFFFNVIFFIAGLGLVAFGAMMMVMMDSVTQQLQKNDDEYNIDVEYYLTLMAIVLMVSGLVLMAICFFGCCGAIKEVKCMLATYAILVGLVIIGELVIVVSLFVFRSKFDSLMDNVNDQYRSNMRKYGSDPDATKSLDDLQKQLKCCGVDTYKEYQDTAIDWNNRGSKIVPESCCVQDEINGVLEDRNCPTTPTYSNSYIGKACAQTFSLDGILGMFFFAIIAIAFGLMAIELIGLIFAICLIRMIGEPRAVPV